MLNILKGNKILKDLSNASLSSITSVLSSVFTGFLVPIILCKYNYGYYKIFILYSSYCALFDFGFVDGIMLSYSGKNAKYIDKFKLRTNSIFFIWFQLIVSIIFIFVSFIITNQIWKILLITLGINTFIVNVTTYYQFISQSFMKFFRFSAISICHDILLILFLLFLFLFYKMGFIDYLNFAEYIVGLLSIDFLILLLYIYIYRDITFGYHYKILKSFKSLLKYFHIGIYLTMSYQILTLIFNMDNQFISWFFNASTYGVYAFAYSLLNVVITVLGSISFVILPHLKQHSDIVIMSKYSNIISYLLLAVYLLLLGYFPMAFLIKIFLPGYIKSLFYLRILFPGVGITCCISLVIFNYYSALNRFKFYSFLNLFVLIISFIIYFVVYILFHSSTYLAVTSLFVLLGWYMISEYFLVKDYHIKCIKNLIYILVMMALFFIVNIINNIFISGPLYFVFYLFISFFMFRKIIQNKISRLIDSKI